MLLIIFILRKNNKENVFKILIIKMLKRKNSLSLMVSKLDTRLIDKFLNLNISKEDLKKFDEQEKREMIAELTDLKNLRNQSESEIYKTLDCMFSNNQ